MPDEPEEEADDHQAEVGRTEKVCGQHVRLGTRDRGSYLSSRRCRELHDRRSVAEVRERLGEVGYLADESAALVSFLAQRLGKPVLVEGPAGVGKTELAKALSRAHRAAELIRLQCYEGLDEAKALYEWNYRKQLLRIQAEVPHKLPPGPRGTAGSASAGGGRGDIFCEDFLLTRPLLEAISAEQPVVLLIDEIDKTDQEFEAMLLEVLSDFQISIPELGVIEATYPCRSWCSPPTTRAS